jgi:hypothetical protein
VRDPFNVEAVLKVRGEFRASPTTWLIPLAVFAFSLYLFLRLNTYPPFWFSLVSNAERVGWICSTGITSIGFGYLVYVCTSTYLFDGIEIICRRITGHVAWSQPLAGLLAVSYSSGRGTSQLILKWRQRQRVIFAGKGLRRAILGEHAST